MRPHLTAQRKRSLRLDEEAVRWLYRLSCEKWGAAHVDRDLTLLWAMRCELGQARRLPFGATMFASMSELLWVAREVCGYGRKLAQEDGKDGETDDDG